jgi:hypothetical protein
MMGQFIRWYLETIDPKVDLGDISWEYKVNVNCCCIFLTITQKEVMKFMEDWYDWFSVQIKHTTGLRAFNSRVSKALSDMKFLYSKSKYIIIYIVANIYLKKMQKGKFLEERRV